MPIIEIEVYEMLSELTELWGKSLKELLCGERGVNYDYIEEDDENTIHENYCKELENYNITIQSKNSHNQQDNDYQGICRIALLHVLEVQNLNDDNSIASYLKVLSDTSDYLAGKVFNNEGNPSDYSKELYTLGVDAIANHSELTEFLDVIINTIEK